MSKRDTALDLGPVRDAFRQAAEETRREQEAMTSLRRLLLEMSALNLRLHRQNRALLDAILKDLQRANKQLKRMSTART